MSRTWLVCPSGVDAYEVRNGFNSFEVDLGGQYCTCRLWEVAGIPCVHAQACILFIQQDPVDYISFWFNKKKYLETYQENILPVNGSILWHETNYTKPLPPIARRMPGRPTIKRKRHVSEHQDKFTRISSNGRKVQCRNCFHLIIT